MLILDKLLIHMLNSNKTTIFLSLTKHTLFHDPSLHANSYEIQIQLKVASIKSKYIFEQIIIFMNYENKEPC